MILSSQVIQEMVVDAKWRTCLRPCWLHAIHSYASKFTFGFVCMRVRCIQPMDGVRTMDENILLYCLLYVMELRCIVANNAYNSLCPNVSMRIILKRCINEMQEQRFSIVEPSTCRFLERMRERERVFFL